MTRTFGPSELGKMFLTRCWISPRGEVIEVSDGKSVKAARKILNSLLGDDSYNKLIKSCKKYHIREDSYLCNNLGWIYIHPIIEKDKPSYKLDKELIPDLSRFNIDYDGWFDVKVPEKFDLSFEQIEFIQQLSGWEFFNSCKLFIYISGAHDDILLGAFKKYDDSQMPAVI